MAYLKTLGIKFIVMTIVTLSLFGIFNHLTMSQLILISMIMTGVSFLGDLFILPRTNNLFTTIADFALFFFLYWGMGSLIIQGTLPLILLSLATAYLLAISEAIIHIYIQENIFQGMDPLPKYQFQTEFAEEESENNSSNKDE